MFNDYNYFKLFTPVKRNKNKRKFNYQILYAIKLAKSLCKVWHVLYAIQYMQLITTTIQLRMHSEYQRKLYII